MKAETGGTFECTATDEAGIAIVLKVTQTDDKGEVVYDYVDAEVPARHLPLLTDGAKATPLLLETRSCSSPGC